jgi:hypothetical protein
MRPQPLISVTDVPRSSRWYQELLGCDSGHGGEEYERLVHDGALVLQLIASRLATTTAGRRIESSGYVIQTATSSCSPAHDGESPWPDPRV